MYNQIKNLILNIFPAESVLHAKYMYLGFFVVIITGWLIKNTYEKRYLPLIYTAVFCLFVKLLDWLVIGGSIQSMFIDYLNMMLIPIVMTFLMKRRF